MFSRKKKSEDANKASAAKTEVSAGGSAPATPDSPMTTADAPPASAAPAGPADVPAQAIDIPPDIPPRFPIFINTNPAINSLSPSGAVVGGSNFTLTVLGSNFGSGSTVEWNQSPRTTTVVSATQLTAAIAAADLAAVANVTVVVSNQGAAGTAPVLSNGVQFSVIPDISSIISQLQAITAIPANLLAELQTYLTIQQSQIDSLTTQVSTDQTNAANLNSQIANLQNQVAQQQTQINTLTAQVQATQAQTASPLDVAQSFKSVLDSIQQAAKQAGGVQTTVTNMNVQVKSLVSVQAATATAPATASLIFPSPTALPDPQHLSTLTFSLGAIPQLSTAGSATPPAPSPVNPTPTPTPPAPTPPAPAPPAPAPAPQASAAAASGKAAPRGKAAGAAGH